MTRVEVERECDKLGWTLANDWSERGVNPQVIVVQAVIYKPAKAPHERIEIGRGNTPHAAYLAACKATDTVPF